MWLKSCLVLILIAISFSCKRTLTAEEGEKHLRAFDNEIISVVNHLKNNEAIAVAKKLFSISTLPIPFKYHHQPDTPFPFNELKGIYRYDSLQNRCIKMSISDSIIIQFPFKSEHDSIALFIIADYSESLSIWGNMFPVKADIKLEIEGRNAITLKSEGIMKYQVPTQSRSIITIEDYSLILDIHSKLSKRKSRMFVDAELTKSNKTLFSLLANTNVLYSDLNGNLFTNLNAQLSIFPIEADVHANFGAIRADSHQFVHDFNKHISIHVKDEKGRHIGNIVLRDKPYTNRINLAVEYEDKTFTYLEDFLFIARELMNVKM